MNRFIIRQILIAIPTILGISFVIFMVLSLAPNDPMSQFAANPAIPIAVRENIRHQLGLDQPWPIRYVKWIWTLITERDSRFLGIDLGGQITPAAQRQGKG